MSTDVPEEPKSVNKGMSRCIEYLEGTVFQNQILGYSTGFPRLDLILSGLIPSNFYILAARPSMGKSTLASNILKHIAMVKNKPVLAFALDTDYNQFLLRLISSEARVNFNTLKSPLSPEQWQATTDAAGRLQAAPIFIDDAPRLTMSDISETADKFKQEQGEIGLVVVDYLQLLGPVVAHHRKDLQIADITRELKALAKDLEAPVLALSQLNRSLEQRVDKRPVLTDLRESGALEEDPDGVIFIYRDEVYNKEPDNPKKGTAELIVAKNRTGPTGTAHMIFNPCYLTFEELTPDYCRR